MDLAARQAIKLQEVGLRLGSRVMASPQPSPTPILTGGNKADGGQVSPGALILLHAGPQECVFTVLADIPFTGSICKCVRGPTCGFRPIWRTGASRASF